jgi:hypothetical protein
MTPHTPARQLTEWQEIYFEPVDLYFYFKNCLCQELLVKTNNQVLSALWIRI